MLFVQSQISMPRCIFPIYFLFLDSIEILPFLIIIQQIQRLSDAVFCSRIRLIVNII